MRIQDQLAKVQEQGASVNYTPPEIMAGATEGAMQEANVVVERLDPTRVLVMKSTGISNAAICEALHLTVGQVSMCLKVLKVGKMRKAIGESDHDYMARFCKALRAKGYLSSEIAQFMRLDLMQVEECLKR
jgi:hypothetical protein